MTIALHEARLCELGVRRAFKPYAEPETGALMLQSRKPATIVDCKLCGAEITLESNLFRIWTPRKRLAQGIATKHGLRARLLDCEAELWVPPELADALLPLFGAKVKKACSLTPEQREAHCARMRLARKKPFVEATSGVPNSAEGVRGGAVG
ncbi:MAG: hypothetical protein PHP45_08395 [Elusimicrobiales bacterium]|nr:hypothetical protein [Elusimicrobiales bacterium]